MYNGFEVQDEMLNSKIYDGTTLKFGIRVAEEDFIVKKNTNAFLYSEYVGSRFIAGLELPVQEVWLGYYKNDLVLISKDFSVKGFSQFQSFKDIRQSKELDLSSKFYTFDDIFRLIDYHTKIISENKEKIKCFYVMPFWVIEIGIMEIGVSYGRKMGIYLLLSMIMKMSCFQMWISLI